MRAFVSTETKPWQDVPVYDAKSPTPDLAADAVVTANFKGFGGCFNELGWKALGLLSDVDRDGVLRALFSRDEMAFNYNRLPIGANDYAESWYSHNEQDGDFAMENFSIARDCDAIIPFIKAARAVHGADFTLFASPWSPPSWMKHPKAYNYGQLVWDERHRSAYADYFVKFVDAYAAAGITINAVHVQNEPDSDQKFPSCVWTGEKLKDFIRDDLSPAFMAAGISTEIWLGTIERAGFNDWIAPSLLDPETRAAISGIGFQWAGKAAVLRTRQAAPELPVIQTENECGDGENTWDYAHYVFDLIQHYLLLGAEAYVYWNMILEKGGVSTWGWRQNSLLCVEPETGVLEANPEFYLLKHFAQFVRPGAEVFTGRGRWAANGVIFKNRDETWVAILQNPLAETNRISILLNDAMVEVELPPKSFATVIG